MQDFLDISLFEEKIVVKWIKYSRWEVVQQELSWDNFFSGDLLEEMGRFHILKGDVIEELRILGNNIYKLFCLMEGLFESEYPLALLFNDNRKEMGLGKQGRKDLSGEVLPIELAYFDGYFLGLRRPVIRIIPSQGDGGVGKDFLKGKKVMILADCLGDTEYAYEEGVHIYEYFNSLKVFDHLEFVSQSMSRLDFLEVLEHYDWVHYAGQNLGGIGGGLVLGEGVYFGFEDLRFLEEVPDFIFLNTCSTDVIFVKKLLSLGVKNIITSHFQVIEESFKEMVRSFYGGLLGGKTVGEGFFETKKENYNQGRYQWIYYTLYGDHGNRLMD